MPSEPTRPPTTIATPAPAGERLPTSTQEPVVPPGWGRARRATAATGTT